MPSLVVADLGPSERPAPRFMADWRKYVRLPRHELSEIDIAVLNLVCALGLPGAEQINVDDCVRTLNGWSETVRRWTDAAYSQFFMADPGHYQNSVAFFRAVSLVNALQKRCGVVFDPAKRELRPDDPFDFDDHFIYAVVDGKGGTCATLPVVFAAVGRRLGYPIKVVCAKQHLFARWEDSVTGDRFNIEGTNEGFESLPDDHYRHWPAAISADEQRRFGYLQSLTPAEELAHFIGQRAAFLEDNGRHRDAAEAYALASDLELQYARHSSCLLNCLREWKGRLQARLPRPFPRLEVEARPGQRQWPASVPWEVEREFAALEGLQNALDDPEAIRRWWQPLRDGRPPLDPPPHGIIVHYPRPETS